MDTKETYNIGKIRSYDNYVGEIIAKDGTYMFINDNLSDEEKLNLNDVVMFRGEEVQGTKKAFFVKKLDSSKNLEEEVLKKLKKL